MSNATAALVLIGGLVSLGQVSPVLADDACVKLQNSKSESRLQYLKGQRAGSDRSCLIYAIKQLGSDGYEPAIKTLIAYLDLREPNPPNYGTQDKPFTPRHGQPRGGPYPAVAALFQIGKVAVPQLVEAIADSSLSELVRGNAGDALLAIYRADPIAGITAMVTAAHAMADPAAANRVMDEARRQASLCLPQDRNECENATLK